MSEIKQNFEMVAKTLKGLEDVLAEELRQLGAENVTPGRRMVSFEGDKAMMYRANICCRTALSILKPIYKFMAADPDTLYEMVKEYDWSQVLSLDKTFSIDTVAHSSEFTHSRFVTYRVKDAIVDYFKDKFGPDKRPGVRLRDADVMINVHIDGDRVTLSLNSSGESLHKRGWRVATTEAPINEVLAAGIILKSGWKGQSPFVDPMCGSGTFLVEAAMIAAGIKPGKFRNSFAFENWPEFDPELFESVLNEGPAPREIPFKIYGSDISPKAVSIAEQNVLAAGVDEYVVLRIKPLVKWDEAPADGTPGVLITNPPYGERINVDDMEKLYETLGSKLKHVFRGYHAWVISSNEDYLAKIGLTPSLKEEMQNGGLDCQLREYIIFDGDKATFRREGGSIKSDRAPRRDSDRPRRLTDNEWKADARRRGMGGKESDRKPSASSRSSRPARPTRPARPGRPTRPGRPETSEATRLLGRRRNPDALLSLDTPRTPSIPAPEGPFMRARRRGWRKLDKESEND
ncbi:MAG: RNA methyltransferase [Barnesiella sp.]|nr:RNA methyltransferase [Bacteroidales bacterium]MBD5250450.1 RNA methyltransferase [Barnesiella sp.]MDE5829216.1 RNA methyltransferase [Duncaniella sp.]